MIRKYFLNDQIWLARVIFLVVTLHLHLPAFADDSEYEDAVETHITAEVLDAAAYEAKRFLESHPSANAMHADPTPGQPEVPQEIATDEAREAKPHPFVRVSNGLFRFMMVSFGSSMGDYYRAAYSPNILSLEWFADPSFWAESVPIGVVAGTASGLLGVFNYEFQYFLDNYAFTSKILDRIYFRSQNPRSPTSNLTAPWIYSTNQSSRVLSPLAKSQVIRAIAKEVDSLLASIKTEYVYMVITTTGLVIMRPDEFHGIGALLGSAFYMTIKGFSAQTFLEVSLARQTRSLKSQLSASRAKIVQNVVDVGLTALSGVVVGAQVASFTPGGQWSDNVLFGLTAVGVANFIWNLRSRVKNGAFLQAGTLPSPDAPPSPGFLGRAVANASSCASSFVQRLRGRS